MHIRHKTVNFRIAFLLAAGSVPSTLISVGLVQYLHQRYNNLINGFILHALGITLILVAILLVLKPFLLKRLERSRIEKEKVAALEGKSNLSSGRWEKRYRPLLTILIGAIVGFLVGLTSVGSGTLIIVSIAFLFPKLGPKELVGTDIFQAFMLLAAGVIGYLMANTINWTIVTLLLIGSLPGVVLGSKFSKYIPDRLMRPIIATVLAISGWKLI